MNQMPEAYRRFLEKKVRMAVANRAIRMGRKGRGHELNAAYFLDGVAHLQAAERELSTLSLFDLLDQQPAQAAE